MSYIGKRILVGVVIGVILMTLRATGAFAANSGVYEAETPTAGGSGSFSIGTRFHATSPGYQVNKIRYWKHSDETGSHTGKLWTDACILLGTATFSGETSSGWQEADMDDGPVTLTEDVVYRVSVTTNNRYEGVSASPDGGPVLAYDGTVGKFSSTGGACPGTDGAIAYLVDALVDAVPEEEPPPEPEVTVVALSEEDRNRLDLIWWGMWAMIGLGLVAMIAPTFLRLLDIRHGMGNRFS